MQRSIKTTFAEEIPEMEEIKKHAGHHHHFECVRVLFVVLSAFFSFSYSKDLFRVSVTEKRDVRVV